LCIYWAFVFGWQPIEMVPYFHKLLAANAFEGGPYRLVLSRAVLPYHLPHEELSGLEMATYPSMFD
jgi:hypothetical protein